MTEQTVTSSDQFKPPVFRRVLVRRVLIGLLLIALVPIVIISLVNFIRTRNVFQTQAIGQLTSLSNSYSQQVNQYISTRRQALDQINQSSGFDTNVAILYQGRTATSYYLALSSVTNYINQYIQTPTEKIFDQVSIIDSAGTVLVSSSQALTGENLTDSYFLKALYQTNSSVFAYDPGGLFPGQLVLVTTKIYKNPSGAPGLTLIGFSTSSLPLSLLTTSQSFFSSSQGYLLTADNKLISSDPETHAAEVNDVSSDALNLLKTRFSTSGDGQNLLYNNASGIPVYGYYKTLPFVQSNLLIEVPQSAVIGQVQSLVPFTLILLAALMVLSGLIVYIASRSMVVPLTDLAKNAQTFAAGDWSYRAKVNRDDEIGQLAYSFNTMVEQLTGYYRSLEEKVETRTHDLVLVSDIAQSASTGLNHREILRKASDLITEKMDIPYHAVYELDTYSNSVILIGQGSKISGSIPDLKTSIPVTEESLIGWCALNKQIRLSGDIRSEKDVPNISGLIEGVFSQIVLPLIVDDKVVGLLDFQSQKPNAFDSESSTVYASLANQLANSMRNIQFVESAQVGLQETNALYTGSRQITVAQSVDEVDRHLSELFGQTEYVAFFFSVLGDQIHLINISDPKGTRLDQSLKGFNIPLARGLSRLSATGMQILEDLKSDEDFNNLSVYFERRGCRSIAMLPISITEQMGYLLVIGSRNEKPISVPQMQPYLTLAQIVGTTIERLSLLSDLNQRVKELNTLSSISQSATNASDVEDLYIRLHHELNSVFGKDVGLAVVLNAEEQKKVEIPYYMEKERLNIPPYPYSDDLTSALIVQGQPILHKDAYVLGLRTIESGEFNLSAKSWMGIPLIIGGKILGGLVLFDTEIANRFSEADRSLLTTVIPQITSSIQNTELLQSQQKALQAFTQERFLLNSLLKNIPDEIIFKDQQGQFIRLSDSAARNLGVENPALLVGNQETENPDLQGDPGSDISVITTATPLLGRVDEVTRLDGKKAWALTSKIPLLTDTGEVSGLLKISRDVTELVSTQNIAKRRADQLLTTSEIAREATTGNLDINETLKRLVELVKTRFGFYHSSIFLLDVLGQFAVLRESTGEAGAQLKAKGHKLAVGSASIIGQATVKGEPVVVGDVTAEPNYYPNPLLPNTKSELGIPLKLGDRIYGALDVQSEEINAFSQEDINILRVLADQLTVTIQNANLYTKTQQTLQRHRILQQVTTSAGQNLTFEDAIRNAVQTLQRIFSQDKIILFVPGSGKTLKLSSYAGFSAQDIVNDIKTVGEGYIGKVAEEKAPQLELDVPPDKADGLMFIQSRSFLAVPIVYANRLLGVIDIESLEPGTYDENDQEIVTTLASNLASLIANIELVDQIRLQVDRQRQLFDITSKIRRSTDVETIMRTSLAEICTALNIRKASIELLQSQEPEDESISLKGK
jgi:PAS domain S-box-containing protein